MSFDNYILCFVTLLLNLFVSFLLMKDPGLQEENENKQALVSRKTLWIYSGVFVVINLLIVALFIFMYPTNGLLFSLKRFCVLALLWPLALIDWKTYRIPNKFVISGLCLRAAIFVAELFWDREYVFGNIVTELITALALMLASFLCSVCMKNSIGYGDIKLFFVMGLLLGPNGIWGAIFTSLIVAFIIALFLLITKRKNKKDVVPFAPSIMIGTYISIILTGM